MNTDTSLPLGVTTGDLEAQDALTRDCDWCGREYRPTELDAGLCRKCEQEADKRYEEEP